MKHGWLIAFTCYSFFLIFSNSCDVSNPSLEKTWFYTLESRQSKGSKKDPVLTPANFLNLQSNGDYTCYFIEFDYGNWEKEGTYIVLKNQHHQTRKLLIQSLQKNELVLDIVPENQDNSQYHFTGIKNPFPSDSVNPYAYTKNVWRVPATHKESDQEITQRLLNHFSYWEHYFNWGLAAKLNYLDVRSLKGPLKLYGNGFALVPFEELGSEWKSLFYDEEDCLKSWNKIKILLQKENITWPKTDNKFNSFVSAFQQLQQKLQ